jgi:hypothetical protein
MTPSSDHPLTPFIGEWSIEAVFPGTGPTGPGGRTTFSWILGGAFMEQRSEVPAPAPSGVIIVAPGDDGTYTQHYFDSRGVVRLYEMTFADGKWELLRNAPDFSPLDFSQRFEGSFSEDGNELRGAWYTSNDGGATWELDFELIYRRV